jgi:hypothetical protein
VVVNMRCMTRPFWSLVALIWQAFFFGSTYGVTFPPNEMLESLADAFSASFIVYALPKQELKVNALAKQRKESKWVV